MKINLSGVINNLSYGIVCTNICTELQKLGIEVALFPIHGQYEAHPKHFPFIKQALQNAEKFERHAPSIRIFHQFDLAQHVGRGRHIGFPIFELTKFTERELHHLCNCDELYVCSQWAKDIIEENNIKVPTFVVPLGVDLEIFTPKLGQREKTIFLSAGKIEKRKGHDILHHIFKETFPDEDNVELWMMWESPHYTPEEILEWKMRYRDVLGDRVKFIPRQASQEDVCKIMQQADCGVFLSRAEGWNLEALEMLACGKQIIVLDYSGVTEFCNKDNSYLVKTNTLELAFDGKWFTQGIGEWASLEDYQVEQSVQHLRKIHQLKQGGNLEINKKGVETAEHFNWRFSAETIVKHLKSEENV